MVSKERRRYAGLASGVFAAEVVIAMFVDDQWVRPLVGDALAVILVYLGLRASLLLSRWIALATALLIAFVVEIGQLFGLLDALALERNVLARVVLGNIFDPFDFLAYLAGVACVGIGEGLWPRFIARGRSYVPYPEPLTRN